MSRFDPNPPELAITWYPSPEAVHRAMWAPIAEAEGMTYEALMAESHSHGVDAAGTEVEISAEEEMAAIRSQGVWGFIDTNGHHIHAWASPDAPRETVVHMLAHEIGHMTGTPHDDDLEEELRAEQFGRVAALAVSFADRRPPTENPT